MKNKFIVLLITTAYFNPTMSMKNKRELVPAQTAEKKVKPEISAQSPRWCLKETLQYNYPVYSVCFHPSSPILATASNKTYTFNLETKEKKDYFYYPDGRILSTCFDPFGTSVTTGENSLFIFDIDKKDPIVNIFPGNYIHSVRFNPSGTLVAAVTDKGKIRIFNRELKKECLSGHHDAVSICFHPFKKLLAIGSDEREKRAYIFDMETQTEYCSFPHNGRVTSVCFDPSGILLATGSSDGTAHIFNMDTQTEYASFQHNGCVNSVQFNHSGTLLATGSHDNKAHIFNIITKKEEASLQHDNWVSSVCFDHSGTLLATGSFDTKARVFALSKDDK